MRWFFVFIIVLWPAFGQAQSTPSAGDAGYLAQLLKDSLSDRGRMVEIFGFEGALSSKATIKQLTIADDDGIWITATGLVLDWQRSALLSGELRVREFSAKSITMTRLPEGQPRQPGFEAKAFALPEIPLSILIERVSAAEIILDKAVLGDAFLGTLQGDLALNRDQKAANLTLKRQDKDHPDRLDLALKFNPQTQDLDLNLTLAEGPNGLIATKLNIPNQPDLLVSLRGAGPLANFSARFSLAAAGVTHLGGLVTIAKEVSTADERTKGENPTQRTRFNARLEGDLRPLMSAHAGLFFGEKSKLDLQGHLGGAQRLTIDRLALHTKALALTADLALGQDGVPKRFHVTGKISGAEEQVLLPNLGGQAAQLKYAEIDLTFDAAQSDAWSGTLLLEGLSRPDVTADLLRLTGSGRILPSVSATLGAVASGQFTAEAKGVHAQPSSAFYLFGSDMNAAFETQWRQTEQSLRMSKISLESPNVRLAGQATLGLTGQLPLEMKARLSLRDLSRVGPLVGQPLAGSGALEVDGTYTLLSGGFDLEGQLESKNLALGHSMIDASLREASILDFSVKRDLQGLFLRKLIFHNPSLSFTLAGQMASAKSRLTLMGTATANLLSPMLAPRALSGDLTFDLTLDGPLALPSVVGEIGVKKGRLSDPVTNLVLQEVVGKALLKAGRADLKLRAKIKAGGSVALGGQVGLLPPYAADLRIQIDQAQLINPPLLDARASGDLRLLGPLAPQLSQAPLRLSGGLEILEVTIKLANASIQNLVDLGQITHLNEGAFSQESRRKAGLIEKTRAQSGLKNPIALDLTIDAPSKVFIRGRGLDAELGGRILLGGTLNDLRPVGSFSLLRGRFDLLGKPLVLTKTNARFEGSFTPYIDAKAMAERESTKIYVQILGKVSAPDVHFTSDPVRPQEEVLAYLLFGSDLATLSPLQVAQMANALASLAGTGAGNIVSKLRRKFALDDLDLSTSASGATTVKLGKYLTENVYSEVAVDNLGATALELNLDLTPTITLRGKTSSDRPAGLGVFIEKDY